MEKEQWIEAPGYKGLYEVSSFGRVKSMARPVKGKGGSLRMLPERIVKQYELPLGYYGVRLTDKWGKPTIHRVHRLICEAFNGKQPVSKLVGIMRRVPVAHIDGNPGNNRLDNLRWSTAQENAQDRLRHGRGAIGDNHPNRKLNSHRVREIRQKSQSGASNEVLAQEYGVHPTTIQAVITRRAWASVD